IMELDDDLPPVKADMNRIIQVLSQLLTNAIQYAPPDTRILIRTNCILDAAQLPAGAPTDIIVPCVLVPVTDEGAGLSLEEAAQVFTTLFRGKEARVRPAEGMGLGLTTARSIIELRGGKFWPEPRKRGRRGARFLFTLPLAEARP